MTLKLSLEKSEHRFSFLCPLRHRHHHHLLLPLIVLIVVLMFNDPFLCLALSITFLNKNMVLGTQIAIVEA